MTIIFVRLKMDMSKDTLNESKDEFIIEVSDVYDEGYYKYIPVMTLMDPLPKLQYRTSRKGPLMISYSGYDKYFRQCDLLKLSDSILKTQNRYVYPLVFVSFANECMTSSTDYPVKFSRKQLEKLRIWANQLRLYVADNGPHCTDVINYFTYVIASEISDYVSPKVSPKVP